LTILCLDNGPGVKKDDVEFVFKPFFTTKGIKGRGLGLYITRQLLERYDYEINYIDKQKNKLLKGANFAVSFFDEETE